MREAVFCFTTYFPHESPHTSRKTTKPLGSQQPSFHDIVLKLTHVENARNSPIHHPPRTHQTTSSRKIQHHQTMDRHPPKPLPNRRFRSPRTTQKNTQNQPPSNTTRTNRRSQTNALRTRIARTRRRTNQHPLEPPTARTHPTINSNHPTHTHPRKHDQPPTT